jgi:hypothetical protein
MCLAKQAGGRDGEGQVYTPADVATHNHKGDCWIVVDSVVYDVTPWLSRHPGGQEILLMYGGDDATDVFKAFHHPRECVPGPAPTTYCQPPTDGDVHVQTAGAAAVPCTLDDASVAYPRSFMPLADPTHSSRDGDRGDLIAPVFGAWGAPFAAHHATPALDICTLCLSCVVLRPNDLARGQLAHGTTFGTPRPEQANDAR